LSLPDALADQADRVARDAPDEGRPRAAIAIALHKRYGSRTALDGLAISLDAGEIVGLLGPNGAGKTTTLSILAGVLRPDAGTVQIAGHDLDAEPLAARRNLGLAPQSLALYPSLTAHENLSFFARMQGLTSAEARPATRALLEQAGLTDRADDLVATFSGGMRRRLNLVCAMAHRPALLLLDEATAGVDPQSRELIFTMVAAAAARGAGCLYSTHYMEEAERLCARVILIDHGRLVAAGTIPQLIARAGAAARIDLVTHSPLPPGWSRDLRGVKELAVAADRTSAAAAMSVDDLDVVPAIVALAQAAGGGGVIEFNLRRTNLQDAFIALTGHALRDAPDGS
jgi:linearmycin/streptolysin S transport system ATP-binding protein